MKVDTFRVQAEDDAHVNLAAATHVAQDRSCADLGGETGARYARTQNVHQGIKRAVIHAHCALKGGS